MTAALKDRDISSRKIVFNYPLLKVSNVSFFSRKDKWVSIVKI